MTQTNELPAGQSAYRAAERANRTANTTGTVGTTPALMTVLMIGFAGLHRSDVFVQQRRMLRGVEEAVLGYLGRQ
jgi:hypothetical protein